MITQLTVEGAILSNHPKPPTYKGRSIGIVILTGAQLLVGGIHIFSGLLLLVFENLVFFQATVAYDVYTFVYGLLVFIFAVLIWQGKKTGWVGTAAVSLFVIAADTLRLLDLPSIPGIPKSAALLEIAYSVLVIGYLCTGSVRKRYL